MQRRILAYQRLGKCRRSVFQVLVAHADGDGLGVQVYALDAIFQVLEQSLAQVRKLVVLVGISDDHGQGLRVYIFFQLLGVKML